ncbi:5-hydroxytryptamine receptor 3E-like [Aulostomus maculatus]
MVITTMGEWELLDITAHKEVIAVAEGSSIDELVFHIRVRRRATTYVVNLLIPSCFLITVDLFSFLLPPQSVDRSSFKMTLILGYTVFMLIMNDLLPATGNTMPLINVFFSLCLALMVASLLETILITNMLHSSASFSVVPRWIQVLVLQVLGCLVCLPLKTKEKRNAEIHMRHSTVAAESRSGEAYPEERGPVVEDRTLEELKSLGMNVKAIRLQVEQKQRGGAESSEDWIQVGFIIDRLLFGLYILFISVSFITIIIIWVNSYTSGSCIMLSCSRPDPPALLEALRPVFNLSSIRPVMNISTPTPVHIDFIFLGILGVDEKAQVLSTYILRSLDWKNEFVSWDPEECGSSWITVPRNLLWVPDVVINEFMEKNSAPFVPYTYLFHDGLVLDKQPVRVVSSCSLDIYTFPFDIQNCSLSFNSYLHRKAALELFQTRSTEEIFSMSKEAMATIGEWELIGMTSTKYILPAGDTEIYEELRFFISVRRRAITYVVNLLIPSCFLITVDLFSFLLPPKTVDRSLFKMTLILGYTVFMLIMNDLLPITGNTIPLINVFLSLCLALMVASLLETILITNLLHGSAHYSPVPGWVRLFVIQMLGRLVRLPPKPKDEDTIIQNPAAQEMKVGALVSEEVQAPVQKGSLMEAKALQELRSLGQDLQVIRLQVEQYLNESQGSEEWSQVGFIIDRLLFCLYVLFISISFITIIIIWVNSYNAS